MPQVYRYEFDQAVSQQDAKDSLLLAVLAAECLHGASKVRLDAGYCWEKAKRSCVIDAGTQVGRQINQLFTGFAIRQFGSDSFKVEPVDQKAKNKEDLDVKAVQARHGKVRQSDAR